jgi:hypothetical protein
MSDNAPQQTPYYESYREFWQNNLQTIEEISSSIENAVASLEKRQAGFDSAFNEILDRIDVLSSIYSGYESISGREYLLKLKSLLHNYRKKHSTEGIDFDAIHFLSARIRELRDKSFEEYPRLRHPVKPLMRAGAEERERQFPMRVERAFRWTTFQRNDSWFIVPCDDDARMVEFRKADLVPRPGGGMSIRWNGTEIEVRDPLSRTGKRQPGCLLVLSRGGTPYCYAADRAGNRIHARLDIITPRLKRTPYRSFTAGSIRLFGRSHIYINAGG